jgi:hypothetical protein
MAKKARVWTGTEFVELASAQTDLTAYSTTAQMNTAINTTSGLNLINSGSFSAATSFSLPTDTFTSTYKNYKLIVQITAVTADADFTARLRTSGTDNTSAVYAFAMPGYTYAGSASNSFGESNSSFSFGESDAGIVRYFLNFDIIAPQLATLTYLSGSYNFLNKAQTASIARTGNMQFTQTTQFDSFSFISSVTSSITGTYSVYGYK